eukprot:3241102-Rhodomonas_salina.2
MGLWIPTSASEFNKPSSQYNDCYAVPGIQGTATSSSTTPVPANAFRDMLVLVVPPHHWPRMHYQATHTAARSMIAHDPHPRTTQATF